MNILEEIKMFLDKNKIPYSDNSDGGICVTDLTNMKDANHEEWVRFWDEAADKIIQYGCVTEDIAKAKWVIKEKQVVS